ncbi:flagellar biosynthesis repressor FlbT [Marivita sp. S0852]|uniref:flagellar biosynthesis repressor FlbT n=1 Tax=Marivita sp. S0852 TaxID=3373893 RepID=UPI0039827A15
MSGLVLKLSPKERVLINGAVIENGSRRSTITIMSRNSKILRLKDAIHPDDINTPIRRACYLAQLLLTGEGNLIKIKEKLLGELNELDHVFKNTAYLEVLRSSQVFLEDENYYLCLKSLRKLLLVEPEMLLAVRN